MSVLRLMKRISPSANDRLLCIGFLILASHGNSAELVASQPLEEVIVQGEREDKTQISLKAAKLLRVPGASIDPMAAILSLPGVTFGSDFDRAPAVRGSAPGDNQFLLDNIPVSYIFHIYGNSIFNSNLVRDFDLLPANFAAKYDNASGAIIDVTLRDPKPQAPSLTLDGSFLYTGLLFETQLSQNQAAFLSYRRSLVDKFYSEEDASNLDDGVQLDNIPVSSDYQYKQLWDKGEHRLVFLAAGARDFVRATFLQNSTAAQRDPDLLGPARIKNGFDSQGIIWQYQASQAWQSELSLNHTLSDSQLRYGSNQRINIKTRDLMMQMQFEQMLNQSHQLHYGMRFSKQDHQVDIFAKILPCSIADPECDTLNAPKIALLDELDITRANAYLEDYWQISPKLELRSGLQVNQDDYLNQSSVEPRFQLSYENDKGHQFKLAIGQYNQLPKLETILPKIGNPNLEYVKTTHTSFGHTLSFNPVWALNTQVYYKRIRDDALSLNASRDLDFADKYSNDLSGRAYGLEFLLSKAKNNQFSGWLAISLSKSERKNDRTGQWIDFDYDRPININWVANYHFKPRWTAGLKWQIQSGLVDTPVVDVRTTGQVLSPVYGEINSQRLPLYHRLDLRLEYQFADTPSEGMVFIDLINAYNRRNVEAYVFDPGSSDLITPHKGYGANVPISEQKSMGIFPSVGIRMMFN